jgi:hypothetical protein
MRSFGETEVESSRSATTNVVSKRMFPFQSPISQERDDDHVFPLPISRSQFIDITSQY